MPIQHAVSLLTLWKDLLLLLDSHQNSTHACKGSNLQATVPGSLTLSLSPSVFQFWQRFFSTPLEPGSLEPSSQLSSTLAFIKITESQHKRFHPRILLKLKDLNTNIVSDSSRSHPPDDPSAPLKEPAWDSSRPPKGFTICSNQHLFQAPDYPFLEHLLKRAYNYESFSCLLRYICVSYNSEHLF